MDYVVTSRILPDLNLVYLEWLSWDIVWYCLQVNATKPHWWLVNIDSGNKLLPKFFQYFVNFFFHILSNFFVSLNLFHIRLKTFIRATSYLLWWEPLAYSTPSRNSSGFFQYYYTRKLRKRPMLLPHVEERRLIVLVIKEVFGSFKAQNATNIDWFANQNR